MATPLPLSPKSLQSLLVIALFVGPAASCKSQPPRTSSFASEEVFNVSTELVSQRASEPARKCLMGLLAAAMRSSIRERRKRFEEWHPFDRGSKGRRSDSASLDDDFLHVPKDALDGLRSVAFSPKCNDLACTDVYRKRPRGMILLSSLNSEDWFVSTSPCSAHVFVDHDVNRWPQSLLKVECACEDIKCSDRGPHTCITVSAPVVLRRLTSGGDWRSSEEYVPVGCVCASMRGRLMHHNLPKIVRR